MKKVILSLAVVLVSGCGVKAEDNRDKLTKEQKVEIENRISSYSQVDTGEAVQVAAVETLPGEAKYASCVACHGAQGQGGVGPMLAGKDAEYIANRLKAYRNNEQIGAQSALMWSQAASLSDQDIQDLAEYVSDF